jgi:hypothetical protein
MRALSLDFRRQSRPGWIGRAMLIAGAVGAVVLAGQYIQMVDEVAQAEVGIRERGVATRKKPVFSSAAGDTQKVALEVTRAREILFQLSMPWNELFASVEAVDAKDVALLSIESDIDKQRVKISAEAKDLDAMLDYLRALEGRPIFADVFLQSHQIQQQDPQRPVRFLLTATWRVSK